MTYLKHHDSTPVDPMVKVNAMTHDAIPSPLAPGSDFQNIKLFVKLPKVLYREMIYPSRI